MKILVFGAGLAGCSFLAQIDLGYFEKSNDETTVIGFLDNDPQKWAGLILGKYPCYHPERVRDIEYDRIIIANAISDLARSEMHAQLLSLGVPEESIELYPESLLREPGTYINTKEIKSWYQKRFNFFKGLARFIKDNGIRGNIAECGVWFGDTAGYINSLFPDRKLYLFDTFEGFTKQDVEAEKALGEKSLANRFNLIGGDDTGSLDIVMEKMTYPENVILKKGWVPQTFAQIDDTFCFVHLDMDLYQPMLAGCKFFWDKLDINGVMVLHDYYSQGWPGTKKAVSDFEAYLGRKVLKLPVPAVDMVLIKD